MAWISSLRSTEQERRAGEAAELADPRAPLHPMRVYGELAPLLDRDAIVIGDGGDFVSYAGRLIDSYEPGCWLDPGPYGCLGTGPGYALAAKLAHPARQVVLLLGDGAFGFAGMELDTLARHGVAVVAVIGNNGIWALEKHPMELLYGYSVAAELRPETRYDLVAEALGCEGELVSEPSELRPGAGAGVRLGQAGGRQRADRPVGRLSAALEPGVGPPGPGAVELNRRGGRLRPAAPLPENENRLPSDNGPRTKTARVLRAASDPGEAQSDGQGYVPDRAGFS